MMQTRLFFVILPTIFLFTSFACSQRMRGSEGLSNTNDVDEQHRELGWLYDLIKKVADETTEVPTITAQPTKAPVVPPAQLTKKKKNKNKKNGN
jgi:hypothetical protein